MALEYRTPPPGGDTSGDLLARHIEEALGGDVLLSRLMRVGRTGRVYLGEQRSLGRTVAVKALTPRYAQDRRGVARFKREARAMAGCPHPSIISVYNVGETDTGIPFFVMDQVEGETLAERLDVKGRLPLAEATRFVTLLSDALTYAHERGLVHRDLKPQHVLIERRTGRVLLTDFGMAKSVSSEKRMVTLTGIGEIIGTPAYLSPEQAECGIVDARSDQYSLAVMAYEMLSGRLPFEGPKPQDFIRQHAQEAPPSLLQVAPTLPTGVARVIDRALMKQPEDRYESAEAFGQALRGAVHAARRPQPGRRPSTGAQERWKLMVVGTIAYLGASWVMLEATGWDALRLSDGVQLPALWIVASGFPVVLGLLWYFGRAPEEPAL